MVYTSNADVFYKRKKNPYRGSTTTGTGYGYGTLAKSMLKSYVGKYKGSKTPLKRKLASLSTVMTNNTRKGKEFEEGGNSLSKCHFGTLQSRIPRAIIDTVARQVSVENGAGQDQSSIGLQSALSFTFAASAGVTAFLASPNDKLVLHSIKGEISMVNSSSSNSTLVLYDIICKKDAGGANASTPVNAWASGIDSAGGSSTDYQVIGSVPTESVTFNSFYKVVQSTRISLGPGQMHRHEVTYNPNRTLPGLYTTNQPYNLAGVTIYTLVVHYGMPAHDSTTTTDVRIDVSAIDYLQKVSYDWRLLEESTTTWKKTNNLATTFAVGEQFVNESVGQVQDSGGLHPGTLHT